MAAIIKPVDFPAAARRHLDDARLLEDNGREPNAGQLYGVGAEYGLKAILTWCGTPSDAEGSPNRPYRVHVDELVSANVFQQLHLFVQGRSGAKYLAVITHIGDFADWRTAHRYYSPANIPGSLAKWRAAADQVRAMLDQARADGLT